MKKTEAKKSCATVPLRSAKTPLPLLPHFAFHYLGREEFLGTWLSHLYQYLLNHFINLSKLRTTWGLAQPPKPLHPPPLYFFIHIFPGELRTHWNLGSAFFKGTISSD